MDYYLSTLTSLFDGITVTAPTTGAYIALSLALLLLLCSAFVSGSEIAFFSLSPADMAELEESGTTADKRVLALLDDSERLLATIRSRVQVVRLRVADKGRSAESNAEFAPLMVDWLRMLFKLKMKELSTQVDKMAQLGREQQKQLLAYTQEVMRDCFLKSAAGMPCTLGSGDEKFDAMFPNMITVNNIDLINAALDDAIFAIERNAYGKIALMELSFRMSKALKKR